MRTHLIPFCGTTLVALAVAVASFPEAKASSPEARLALEPSLRAVSLTADGEDGVDNGVYSGEILGVDLPRGSALLSTAGEERLVRGTPAQLRGLAPGDAVEVRFRTYGDATWLWPADDGMAQASRFATFGVITGSVEGVDPFGGIVRVGGQHLLAHPELLRNLSPGERISLRFARVGAALWALSREGRAGGQEYDDL